MNGLSLWQPLTVVCAVVLTALVSFGVAWLVVQQRARRSSSGDAAGAAIPAQTTSAFIDLDPRGLAPRARAHAAQPAHSAHPAEPPMAPQVTPLAPPTIAATTLAGRARAQIRVVATTDSPARAAFPRRSSHLRLVQPAAVEPLDGAAAAGQDAQDARTA